MLSVNHKVFCSLRGFRIGPLSAEGHVFPHKLLEIGIASRYPSRSLLKGCKSTASLQSFRVMGTETCYTSAWLRARSSKVNARSTKFGELTMEDPVPPFDLKNHIASIANNVNLALDSVLPVKYPEKVFEAMRYSLLSHGKRVLPVLCITACELVGGTREMSMPTACALEMIHATSLMHDDLPCIDNGDLRRGKPANHKVFGENTTLLAGDSLLAFAFETMTTTPSTVSAEKVVRCIAHLGKSIGSEGVVAGEILDLASENDPSVSLETLEYIHVHKTAVFVESAAACGAILGGGSEVEIESLSSYGRCLGLLHQVVDDILDVTKTSEDLGKPAGKDLLSRKATYPKILGLEESKEFAQHLARKAKGHLSPFDRQNAAPLFALADYIANRQS